MRHAWAMAGLSLCLMGGSAWGADDPQTGRWVLNLAKSHYVTGVLPKSSVATAVPFGADGVSLTVEMVTAAGTAAHIQYSAQYDGKRYPRTESGTGAPDGQMVTLKRTGPRTVEREVFLGDKSGGIERWVISADGKTRTVTQSGTDLNGKPIDNLQVYEKP